MASVFSGRVEQLKRSAPEIAQQDALRVTGAHHQKDPNSLGLGSRIDPFFDFRPTKEWDPGILVVEDFLTEEQESQILESLGRI